MRILIHLPQTLSVNDIRLAKFAAPFVKVLPEIAFDDTGQQRELRPYLPQHSNNLFIGKPTFLHSCTPILETLTFQCHIFQRCHSIIRVPS
ncbi:hypothetical protein KM92DES2_10646 [uncultured Desulfovibrio sp.]|uniref:Uncharacterized protein n=1 Tax=uncultured Desulfovibrio sp. TaxID=167968 RepID=A0A212J783_9BACT|nr:hypothetical protein KM92DES2_10646 [uncultured Desulfovibrio sp.]